MLRSLESIQLSFMKYWYSAIIIPYIRMCVTILLCARIPEWPTGVRLILVELMRFFPALPNHQIKPPAKFSCYTAFTSAIDLLFLVLELTFIVFKLPHPLCS